MKYIILFMVISITSQAQSYKNEKFSQIKKSNIFSDSSKIEATFKKVSGNNEYNPKIKSTTSDLQCKTSIISVNAKSSSFMNANYAAQSQFIFPGAIYNLSDFWDGNFNYFDNNRNSIILSTDNSNSKNPKELIKNPSLDNIRVGIAKLYSNFDKLNSATNDLRYQVIETNSKAELSLKLNTGIGLPTFSIDNEFKYKNNENRYYLTIDASKSLFSIIAKSKINYFNKKVPNLKNPIMINSVQYGIRILANIEIIINNREEFDNFKSKYKGLGTNSKVDFEFIKNSENVIKNINGYIVGGPSSSKISFTKENLKEEIEKIISEVNYSNAKPISYTLSDLNNNIIGVESSVENIKIRECIPLNQKNTIKNVRVKIKTGGDNKDKEIGFCIGLYSNREKIKLDAVPCPNANNQNLWKNKNELLAKYENCTQTEFVDDSENSFPLDIFKDKESNSSTFENKGGQIIIQRNHKKDKWKIKTVTLDLEFKNGTKKIIVWDLNGDGQETGINSAMRFTFSENFEKIDSDIY